MLISRLSSRSRMTLAVLASLQAGVAGAQAGPQLEEIVVTAQKRAESLQEVPIAITAITDSELTNRGITNSDDVARLVPNLTWTPAGGAGSVVGLRGIVDVNFTTGQVGSVAIVSDDVGLNSPVANTFALMDLERVEVLRGPQVTLYGRSTTGGAINFLSKRPTPGGSVEGYAAASLGNFGTVDLDGAISFPLGERAGLRIAALSNDRDGNVDNRYLGTDDGARRRQAGRMTFVADVTDDFQVFAKIHAGRQRGQSTRYKNIGYFEPDLETRCPGSPRVGSGCADAFGFVDTADYSENFSGFPNVIENVDLSGGLLNLTWNRGAFSFTSITAYEENDFSRNEDTDGQPLSFIDVSIDATTRQFTQEFRLASTTDGPFKWLVGAYYLDETQHGITTLAIRLADAFISTAYDQDDTIYSGYGQVDYAFNERWSMTAGVRYSDETKEGLATGLDAFDDLTGRGMPPEGVFIDEAVARSFADPELYAEVPFGKTWGNWGGKIGLNFTPDANTLVYGTVSKSFKGGVFNLAAGPVLADPEQAALFQEGVNPEKLLAYEVGAKMTLLDGRMQVNLAAFYNDYKDQQLYILMGNLGIAFINAAAATIKGIEGELRWKPAAGTTITAGAGWLDAHYDELFFNGEDLAGNRMILVPEFNAQLGLRQEWALGPGRLSADIGLTYASSQFFDLLSTLGEGAHTTADARLEYAFGDKGAYRVGLWGRNITDERFTVQAFDLGTGGQAVPNEPRYYGVSFRVDF